MSQVIVLVPAHNEEVRLPATLSSILRQSRPPDRLIVVSDNSTDRTVALSRSQGVEVMETVANRDKKAGALNQALDRLNLPDETFVLIVDADTRLSNVWIETALETFEEKAFIGAVGGIFQGDGENGWFGSMQSLEYWRYAGDIKRLHGEARVLTGTATMAPMSVFRKVRALRRQGRLPGSGYYNLEALTEDFEMTVSIKRLGYRTVSPLACTVVTETMPDVPQLWKQRVRWQRGAVDTLRMHGWNRVTRPYVMRQAETLLMLLANVAIWGLATWSAASGTFALAPMWILIGLVFYLERIASSLGGERKGIAIAATAIGDMAFDAFISAVWCWCLLLTVIGRERTWGNASIDTLGPERVG